MKKYRLWVAVALICLLAAAWSHGTTLVYLSIDDLASLSDTVVVGTVVETRSYLERDGQTIFTAVTIEISESMKGDARPNDRVTIHHLGGEVDGIALRYASMPSFRPDTSVAVFLKQLGPETFGLVGMAQGVLDVEERGDRTQAIRRLGAMRFINPEFPGRGPVIEEHEDESYTLGEMRSRILENESSNSRLPRGLRRR